MNKWKKKEENLLLCKKFLETKSIAELKEAKTFLENLKEYKKLNKLYTTYINGTKKALEYTQTGKVYVDYDPAGTVTGRLSCRGFEAKEGKMGLSFHTLARDDKFNIRSMYVAPKDHAVITSDYKAQEMRIMAHLSKEDKLIQAFLNGMDPHLFAGSLTFDKPETKVSIEERQLAKATSFLVIYGGSEYKLAEDNRIPLKRAAYIIAKYAEAFPKIFEYKDFLSKFLLENGYVYTLFGRRRHLPDVYSKDIGVQQRALRQALNYTVQSPASDTTNCALLSIDEKLKDLISKIIGVVHDSIETYTPFDEIEQVVYIIKEQMLKNKLLTEVFGIKYAVPLEIDIHVGKSFGDGIGVKFIDDKISNMDEILSYVKS